MRRRLPPVSELVKLRDKGMTYQQIIDHLRETTGEEVTISAISQAFARAGIASQAPRYPEVIPWRVATRHQGHYHLRMLRLHARDKAGSLPDNDPRRDRLVYWRKQLDELNAVVHYVPEEEPGFFLVPKREGVDENYIRVPDELLAAK